MLTRTFSKEQTRKNFSGVAWFYDLWGRFTEYKALNMAINISGLTNNVNVIDVGVGTGQLFSRILEINTKGLNSGMDLSLDMINKVNKKFKNTDRKIILAEGNAYNLPYKDEQFDFLFSSYMMDLLPEKDFRFLLSEFNRVMKPGATGLIISMSMGNHWYNRIWFLTAKYFPSLLTECRPVQLSGYLADVKFNITEQKVISQNTFPSEIIKFYKF